MFSDTSLTIIILFIILEIYEVSWQKAPTLMGMLINMHKYYSKNIILFFLMHPTFYFLIGFAILTNYNAIALTLLAIKTMDMVTKILLIQQVFQKQEVSRDMHDMLIAPLNNFLPYIGLLVYPPLIYLAI